MICYGQSLLKNIKNYIQKIILLNYVLKEIIKLKREFNALLISKHSILYLCKNIKNSNYKNLNFFKKKLNIK